jgi:hypothetical protein
MSGDLESAVKRAFGDARVSGEPHPVVLLSPACASYDQFRDYEERGDKFKAFVVALGDGGAMPSKPAAPPPLRAGPIASAPIPSGKSKGGKA